MKHFLKRRAEHMLSSSLVGRMTQYRIRGKRLVLAYHGIVPHGEQCVGERSLFVRQRDFSDHLDVLREIADVAPLTSLDAVGDGRPRVSITFDDAYRGAIDAGVAELVARGLPATIFVAPGRLNDHVFWWDALAGKNGVPSNEARDYAVGTLCGVDERIRQWATSNGIPFDDNLPDYARSATEAELRGATSQPGITLGSHTWSHPNLAGLTPHEIRSEVVKARSWLSDRFGEKAIPWMAYPYGIDSAAARSALAKAGYSGAFRIVGGWHSTPAFSPFSRPRFNVPAGLSAAGLRTRLVGAVLA
ncbi:MAG TPA: polysaccharide deacetylase family protein [Gemmatimonadaceae bacterium]|nr:polysaccharide deacetylase family protein [Gemmatimonadaceae bacterium]